MPTAGKLIGAIVFAALAYFIGDLIKPLLVDTEGSRVGWLSPVNALIGLVMGWTIIGKGAGKTYRQSFGYGLTTLAASSVFEAGIRKGGQPLGRASRIPWQRLADPPLHMIEPRGIPPLQGQGLSVRVQHGRKQPPADRAMGAAGHAPQNTGQARDNPDLEQFLQVNFQAN